MGLDAPLRQAWRVLPDGTPVPSNDPIPERSLGFQIRYRRELAPLSDLFIVYGRGGYSFNGFSESAGSLLDQSFALRDSEQLLTKVSYRFER